MFYATKTITSYNKRDIVVSMAVPRVKITTTGNTLGREIDVKPPYA
jgi:hypothetical protein